MTIFKLSAGITFLALLTGCAGRNAYPVPIHQFGDEQKSCQAIHHELRSIENNIQRLVPETNKTTKNIALGVAGLVVWPAWLFMDLSTAEKEEIHAYRIRYDYLVNIADNKNCDLNVKS